MRPKLIPLGVLLFPSSRVLAYTHVFRELCLCPSDILVLQNTFSLKQDLCNESRLHDYSQHFFDPDPDPLEYFQSAGAKIQQLATKDVNHPMVHEALRISGSDAFLFTGGGILTHQTLGLKARWYHIHPGEVPNYRGSTCFYYSLLEKGTLAATAFAMAPGIDTGEVVCLVRFKLNYMIQNTQPLFMDHILDPYIRAQTLRKLLLSGLALGELPPTSPQPESKKAHYFVIHALLRLLTIQRVNQAFNPSTTKGIFECP